MNVTVTPEAAAFIQRKGGHLILFQAEVTGCCGIGSAPMPMYEVATPRRPPDAYRTVGLNGITVHIDKDLDQTEQEISISLSSVFGWHSLSLSNPRTKED